MKPENVLIDQDGFIKLADFGLSVDLNSVQSQCRILGTLDYMAPEVFKKYSPNKTIDYWALGCLFIELVTGRSPFYDSNPNVMIRNILLTAPRIPKFLSREAKHLVK